MVDTSLVTVTNNPNPTIQLEIIAYKNEVDVEFVKSFESALSVHNVSSDAHLNILTILKNDLQSKIDLKSNTVEVNEALLLKADSASTYTKSETNSALSTKIDASDITLTKQGNTFNGASQLVQLTSEGKLPAIDASLLTGLANSTLSNITLSTALTNLGFAGQSLTTNGYYRFPNGLIIQWGKITSGSDGYAYVTFPIAFSTVCFGVFTQRMRTTGDGYGSEIYPYNPPTTTQFYIYFSGISSFPLFWYAIGY